MLRVEIDRLTEEERIVFPNGEEGAAERQMAVAAYMVGSSVEREGISVEQRNAELIIQLADRTPPELTALILKGIKECRARGIEIKDLASKDAREIIAMHQLEDKSGRVSRAINPNESGVAVRRFFTGMRTIFSSVR